MRESPKVTILLADEDALRRDGLAAVLSERDQFEVIAGVADGEAALQEIRDLRPEVAIVDLNLPKFHGIELVRRVRSESPGTRVIILAGTADDDVVREAVRAGADAYLLNNGPARHLIDAISYVRDGGQYFSPQLKRDGRDRRLLEEPPRSYPDSSSRPAPEEEDIDRSRAHGTRRAPASGRRLRDRIRQEATGTNLGEHDYEIMSAMADGIRPILDRLDEIDDRVAQMETGSVPVPEDPRGWLSTQLADTWRGGDVAVTGRSITDLEAQLPAIIEETVTKRFQQMAGKLQQEIEETHVRTLESFVRNIQVKLVKRVSALEQDMSRHAESMQQLREYSQRTEDNLSRLITGVDKLAQELPKRLQLQETAPAVESLAPEAAAQTKRPKKSLTARMPKIFWMSVGGCLVAALLVWGVMKLSGRKTPTAAASAPASSAPVSPKPAAPAGGDTKTRMQAADEYIDHKDYAMAEDILKQIVKAEPQNTEALQKLASVLYREDKIDESAAVLEQIPKK